MAEKEVRTDKTGKLLCDFYEGDHVRIRNTFIRQGITKLNPRSVLIYLVICQQSSPSTSIAKGLSPQRLADMTDTSPKHAKLALHELMTYCLISPLIPMQRGRGKVSEDWFVLHESEWRFPEEGKKEKRQKKNAGKHFQENETIRPILPEPQNETKRPILNETKRLIFAEENRTNCPKSETNCPILSPPQQYKRSNKNKKDKDDDRAHAQKSQNAKISSSSNSQKENVLKEEEKAVQAKWRLTSAWMKKVASTFAEIPVTMLDALCQEAARYSESQKGRKPGTNDIQNLVWTYLDNGRVPNAAAAISAGAENLAPSMASESTAKSTGRVPKDSPVLWNLAKVEMGKRVNRPSFNTWLNPVSLGEWNGTVNLIVPDEVFQDWIDKHYAEIVCDVLQNLTGEIVTKDDLRYEVRTPQEEISITYSPNNTTPPIIRETPAPVNMEKKVIQFGDFLKQIPGRTVRAVPYQDLQRQKQVFAQM